MAVKTDEKIYVHKRGLLAGPEDDVSHTLIPDITPHASCKHLPESPIFSSASKMPRLLFDDTDLSSRSSSPFPLSSPQQSDAASLDPPTVNNSTAASDDFDHNWDLGFVLTPLEPHIIWPNGMYVCDMAKAFELLAPNGGKTALQARFTDVFQGKPWKESTYHKNHAFWTKLPLHVRQQAGNLPCTDEGLWTKWRRSQPGWC